MSRARLGSVALLLAMITLLGSEVRAQSPSNEMREVNDAFSRLFELNDKVSSSMVCRDFYAHLETMITKGVEIEGKISYLRRLCMDKMNLRDGTPIPERGAILDFLDVVERDRSALVKQMIELKSLLAARKERVQINGEWKETSGYVHTSTQSLESQEMYGLANAICGLNKNLVVERWRATLAGGVVYRTRYELKRLAEDAKGAFQASSERSDRATQESDNLEKECLALIAEIVPLKQTHTELHERWKDLDGKVDNAKSQLDRAQKDPSRQSREIEDLRRTWWENVQARMEVERKKEEVAQKLGPLTEKEARAVSTYSKIQVALKEAEEKESAEFAKLENAMQRRDGFCVVWGAD